MEPCAESWVQGCVARVQAGDTDAFGALVDAYQSPIRGFIAMLGVPSDRIEDVAQETFLAAYRDLPRFDGKRPFGPWLRGIARNFARRLWTETSDLRLLQGEAMARLLSAPDAESSVDDFPDRFKLEYLLACLKGLSDRPAALIRQRYVDGRNSAEIARSMDVRPDAVRVALARIRLKLKECVSRRMAMEAT